MKLFIILLSLLVPTYTYLLCDTIQYNNTTDPCINIPTNPGSIICLETDYISTIWRK